MGTQKWTELNRSVTVALSGLSEWAASNDTKNLRLFLAGRVLPAEPTLVSLSQNYLNFQLEIDQTNQTARDLWVEILWEARQARNYRVPISVGLQASNRPFDSDVYITLNVYPWYTNYIGAFLVLLLVGLFWLAWRTALLRDGPEGSPFSLGRVQMAAWFYLVIAAYLFIWLITGGYNSLTSSVLTLIGISGGTGLAAAIVDRSKEDQAARPRRELTAQQAALNARIAEIEATRPAAGSTLDQELQEKRTALAEATARLAALPALRTSPTSRSFFRDILSDGDGISFHRFQIVVWTVVFASIFVRSVYRDLAMPDFDASLLGLMGISSGTYLGFKFPEAPKQ
jgi:hypothetical protein